MHILLDKDVEGTSWQCWSADKPATFGQIFVGPIGMLQLLETALGLGGPAESDLIRAAAMLPAVRDFPGAFWSESAQADPLGVAKALLGWRDFLWLHGWRGAPLSPRLRQLAKATKEVIPGLADRLERVAGALETRTTDIDSIGLLEPREKFPLMWRHIFERLEKRGTVIDSKEMLPVAAKGDLLAARSSPFNPQGDGSLQLIRPFAPLEAAEHLAAWLAVQNDLEDTLVINSDEVLDAALRRYGLPTSGAQSSHHHTCLLEILPLVLSLGWNPPDPHRALELLALPVSPIPGVVGGELIVALQTWPAVDSDVWKEALIRGLNRIPVEKNRKQIKTRLDVIFSHPVSTQLYPVTEITRRTEVLVKWLRNRVNQAGNEYENFVSALNQCENFRRLLQFSGFTALTEAQLQKLLKDAHSLVPAKPVHPAEAGLRALPRPDMCNTPVKRAIWWNFSSTTAPTVSRSPFSLVEREALKKSGVHVPDPASHAIGLAERWRRSLLQTSDQLILVCPVYGQDAAELHPHPLWHEITARIAADGGALKLVSKRPFAGSEPVAKRREVLAAPTPQSRWNIAAKSVSTRQIESATSIESLLRCPFAWTMRYIASIQSEEIGSLPRDQKVLGLLAHEILPRVLVACGSPLNKKAGEKLAEQLFDREGPRLAAALFRPGAESLKAAAKRATLLAARALLMHLNVHESSHLFTPGDENLV